MSVELDLLMVDSGLLKKHERDPLLVGLWDMRYVLDLVRGVETAQALTAAREFFAMICDPSDLEATWTRAERLIRAGELPAKRLRMGSEWQRLDTFFEREKNEAKRELLRSAFYGTTAPLVRLEASYGPCKLVSSDEARAIGAALRAVDMGYLQSLPDDGTAQASMTESTDALMTNFAKAFGLDAGAIMSGLTPEFLAAANAVSSRREQTTPEDFDLDSIDSLATFYEAAAQGRCGVICGIS